MRTESRYVLVMISPYSQPRMNGIAKFAKEHRWSLVFADRLEDYDSLTGFDGILMTLRDKPQMVKTARRILADAIPVVDLTIERPDVQMPRVVSDHRAIGAAAARHFMERGFDNFAWFSASWSHVHELRYEGFRSALPEGTRPAKWHAKTVLKDLASTPKPVAVFAYNEPDAARLVFSCRSAGVSVPMEVSIVGVGNDPILSENQETTISSVDQNLANAAYAAAARLEKLMSMPPSRRKAAFSAKPVMMPPGAIVARDSSDTLAHSNPKVRAAMVYIHSHLGGAFGAREVAAGIGITRRRLDALFATELHRSVGDEILRQRMLRVKRLIMDRTLPLKAIASACGFCNAAYLTNLFHRETGMSPRKWRARQSAKADVG